RPAVRDVFTLDAQYFQDLFLARSLSLAGYVILVYECLATLADEYWTPQIKYIWPTRWSSVKLIYIVNRYGTLISMPLAVAQLFGVWWDYATSFCFDVALAFSFLQFASFAAIHVLVLLRAWATWNRQKRMLTVLVVLFSSYASISIAFLTYGVVQGGYDGYPFSRLTKTCIGTLPRKASSQYLVLETATFVLTMASIRQFKVHLRFSEHSPLVQVICRDAVLYFLVTLFSNLLNILIWCVTRPLNMLSTTFTLCLMIVAGQRLVLDLRKETDHDDLSTTRVGREIERAIEALPRSRSPSPIVFAEGQRTIPRTPEVVSYESPALERTRHLPPVGMYAGEILELAALGDVNADPPMRSTAE
ncbi:hypothetical protein BD414DRAFT_548706, partial [Trametes punicea]